MVCFCESGDEHLIAIKCGEFLETKNLKDSDSWSKLVSWLFSNET